MQYWSGSGAFQWEHVRAWDFAAAGSQFCRAEGALALPGGLNSFSVFFRRVSQTASTVELCLWTCPVWYNNLDGDVNVANATQQLLKLTLAPGTALQMTGTAAQVYGAALATGQAMGTLLFWEMKASAAASIVGDIHVVPNHGAVVTGPRMARALDPGAADGVASLQSLTRR